MFTNLGPQYHFINTVGLGAHSLGLLQLFCSMGLSIPAARVQGWNWPCDSRPSYKAGGRHTAWPVISPHPPTPGVPPPPPTGQWMGQREEGWESSTGVFCCRSPQPQGLIHCVRCANRDQKHFISGKALSGERSALENTDRIPSFISYETRV